MNGIFKCLAIGIPVSCAALSVWWAVKKYRQSETEECAGQDKEELNSQSSTVSAIEAETSKEKVIPVKEAPNEGEGDPISHLGMKSTVESRNEELKKKEGEEKPQKAAEKEERPISQSDIETQASKKAEDDKKRRQDLYEIIESSQIKKDEEEIEKNVSENSNTFASSNPNKEKVKPLWTPKRKQKSKKKRFKQY